MEAKPTSIYTNKEGFYGGHIYWELNGNSHHHSDSSGWLLLRWPAITFRMK